MRVRTGRFEKLRSCGKSGQAQSVALPNLGGLDPTQAATCGRIPLGGDRILCKQLGKKRLHLTNNQRRRLAVCAKASDLLSPESIRAIANLLRSPNTVVRAKAGIRFGFGRRAPHRNVF